MKRISIKMKIMIWFTAAMIIMVVGTSAVNFFISRQVLDQSIQERLLDTVSSNAQEIEYRSSVSGEREAQDFFLSYNGGVLEIDDDFLNYSEGIYTALVDSDNNLLYGELPVRLDSDEAFSYTAVGTIKSDGKNSMYTRSSFQVITLKGSGSEASFLKEKAPMCCIIWCDYLSGSFLS